MNRHEGALSLLGGITAVSESDHSGDAAARTSIDDLLQRRRLFSSGCGRFLSDAAAPFAKATEARRVSRPRWDGGRCARVRR